MFKFNRRQVLQAGAAGIGIVGAPHLAFGQGAPIKIGAILPRQGPFAVHGEAAARGIQVALDQVGNRVKGRPVELITYDDPTPQTAQQNMRKLIDENKVVAVIGGNNSATGLGLAAVAAETRTPTIITAAVPREITGKNCSPYVFRVNQTADVYAKQLAREALPVGKRWYFLYGAYAFGQESYRLLKQELTAAGGSDVGADAAPVGTSDFSSVILKIRQAKPDMIMLAIAGNDLVSFLKQYDEFGLRGKIPLATIAIADEDLWAQTNPAGLVGKFWHFNNPRNSPAEVALNEAVMKASGRPASQSTALAWVGMRLLLEGIDKAKDTNAASIVAGIEQARPNGLGGYFRAWDHQYMAAPVIGQVREKVANKYDPLEIVSKPLSAAEVETLHGTQQESECKMPKL